MKISPDWTPEERLAVIGKLAARVIGLPMKSGLSRELELLQVIETIGFVASKSAQFLETNRRNIEHDLGEPS